MATVDVKLIKQLRDRTSLSMNDCKKALVESDGDIEVAIDLLKTWGDLKGKEKEARVATEGKVWTFSNHSATIVGIAEVNCQTDFVANSKEFHGLLSILANKLASDNMEKFETLRKELVAKTGENIVLRRQEVWADVPDNSFRVWYNHPGNRLATIVEFVASSEEVFRKFRNMTYEIQMAKETSFADDIAMQTAAMGPHVVSKNDLPKDTLERQQKIFEAQLAEEKKPAAAWPKIIEGKFGKWRKEVVLLEQESITTPKKSVGELLQEFSTQLGGEIKISRFVRYALGEGLEKKIEDYAEEVNKLINQ